ncbi:MAG TPA: hypothetical protein VD995_25140 [Azospirillum sp.]|nr:hypothetical protein [Azospirillum sp.]
MAEREDRGFLDRGGPAAADAAPGKPRPDDASAEGRSFRRGEHIEREQKPDQLAEKDRNAETRQEALIDESVEETFPASDPPSPKHIT